MSGYQVKIQDIFRQKHSMERQSRHRNKTEIAKGYWAYKTRNLKQL